MTVYYGSLPEHMQDGARRYVEQGIEPGDFMLAVLRNDLVDACERADGINLNALVTWAAWVKWECPLSAWGSVEKVNAWIKHDGQKGQS